MHEKATMACGSRRRSFSGKVVRLLREGGSAYSDLRRLPSVTAASSFRRNRDASAYCRIEVPEQSGTNIMLSSVMSDAASRRVDSSNPLRAKSDRTSDSDVNSGISRGNCKVTTNRTSSSRSHRTIGGSSFQRKSDVYGAVHGRGRSFDLGTVLQRVTALVSSKLFVFMLLIVGLGAADDSISSGGGLRPQWIPLVRGAGTEADKAILELFGSSEVLQMYHLQVRVCEDVPTKLFTQSSRTFQLNTTVALCERGQSTVDLLSITQNTDGPRSISFITER